MIFSNKIIILKNRKIIKQINRDEIGTEALKISLKEAIMFTRIQNEDLLHNYLRYFIEEKNLYVVMECYKV